MKISYLQAAISFMTRFPVGRLKELDEKEWAKVTTFFPLAGYALAAVTIVPISWLISLIENPTSNVYLLMGGCATVLLAYLTRGLHLDGVGDMADGYGVWTKEKRLEVMKDSCSGAFGVIAIVSLLLLKVLGFAILFEYGLFLSAFAAIIAARFIIVLMCQIGKYPREKGTAMSMVGAVTAQTVALSALFILPLFSITLFWAVLVIQILTMIVIKQSADDKIGGVTGDILGATCEITEVVGVISFIIFHIL